jgi:hypothetical protein
MLGLAVVGFVLATVGRPGQLALHSMTTLPTLLGIGALTAARSLATTPKQVSLGPEGMSILGKRGQESFAWSQIGWATITNAALNNRRHLVVFDAQGKTIAKLSDAFTDFDDLVAGIQGRIARKAEQGDDTADRIRARKARRSAVFMVGFAIVMTAVAAANVWNARREQRAARLLAESSVAGEAEIVRRFLAPNGVTPRLEYRITNSQGRSATRNAEVFREFWDSLDGAQTVPVTYVADEPEISRLLTGEVPEDPTSSPIVMYLLSAAVVGISLLALVAAVLQFNGWDIDLDSKTGKISIKRFGTGR